MRRVPHRAVRRRELVGLAMAQALMKGQNVPSQGRIVNYKLVRHHAAALCTALPAAAYTSRRFAQLAHNIG